MEYRQQFELDFMCRTLDILKSYAGPYDATLLLNCLVGLLIVPKESSLDRIPEDHVSQLKNWGVSPSAIIQFGRSKRDGPHPKTLRQLVHSLRNSVAHFRFRPRAENGVCTGFDFDDESGFQASIEVSEMREFVERLAKHLENAAAG